VGGNILEEDGVDHRAEPSMWLTDGAAEGAPADPESRSAASQSAAAAPAEDADQRPDRPMPGSPFAAAGPDTSYRDADVPYTGQQEAAYAGGGDDVPRPPAEHLPYAPPVADPMGNGAGPAVTAPQPSVPPLPAQVPPGPGPRSSMPSVPGMAAKVTAPFAALAGAKPKIKPRKPARQAQPRKPPRPAQPGVAARVAPSARPLPKGSPAMVPTRRAQLVLSRIEPWSVMKFSFMISLVGWVVLFVAVAALYYVLSKLGVFHSIQSTITDVTSSKGSSGTDANGQWFSASRVLGYTMLVGAINVVLITALATVGAVVYNLVSHLAGGIEVTLKETD
jgi:hypothetical protein